jgi:hypothetical protein
MNMKRLTPERIADPRRAAACSLVLALAACAGAPQGGVPERLKPAANESLAMTFAAKGVQIYECRARKDAAAGYEWAFVAPEADLFDARGHTVGHHGAGPVWQASDGSRVLGTVKERADAPVAGAIPWLLLGAKPAGPEGSLSKVASIQRVNTAGGVAPSAGCSRDTTGKTARIAYSADYRFFTVR